MFPWQQADVFHIAISNNITTVCGCFFLTFCVDVDMNEKDNTCKLNFKQQNIY